VNVLVPCCEGRIGNPSYGQASATFASVQHGSNGRHEERWAEDGTDAKRWAFDRLDTYWVMAPLPPTDVATYL
jgi:hypothetical protein